eukprot:TRINITY_DN8175_c0_g1_i1.p2 TRINITY_DN8175_c0_g1~~TRINITY_DN8175_c0_g1_i1.p2  ORF type:complete len:228 (-),score=24.73 TRINITY_DN8175_c0_g1_i1:114-797(-)
MIGFKVACQVILLLLVGIAFALDCDAVDLHVHNFGSQPITLKNNACEEKRIENGTDGEVSLNFLPGVGGRIWLALGNVTWPCGENCSFCYYVHASCGVEKGMRMRLGFSANGSDFVRRIFVRVTDNTTTENATDKESLTWKESGAVSIEEHLMPYGIGRGSGQPLVRLSVTHWRNDTYDAHLYVLGGPCFFVFRAYHVGCRWMPPWRRLGCVRRHFWMCHHYWTGRK